jgi:hypothetical protein
MKPNDMRGLRRVKWKKHFPYGTCGVLELNRMFRTNCWVDIWTQGL